MIVSVTKLILETLYQRRAALYLFLYEGPYEDLKRKQWNCAMYEVYDDTALAMPENSWDVLLPEEIGHEIKPL